MKLLNAHTRKLESFAGYSVPAYAILSHTWGAEEVTLQDLTTDPNVESKGGFAKIRYTCDQAIRDGLQFCWVDTCCIDKTSSAELSEAINSMFLWYQNARVCYAYLSDVTGGWPGICKTHDIPNKDIDEHAGIAHLAASRWFTRGWTLQELIAPRHVVFFDGTWKLIGSRANMTLPLNRITRIDAEVLSSPGLLWKTSVAKRMSWASHRQTTRKEDEAYCLLGLFNINMPLLYGEGQKSFIRLQEAIVRESTDHSIFAWDIESKLLLDTNNLARLPAVTACDGMGMGSETLGDHEKQARLKVIKLKHQLAGEVLAPSVQHFANAADVLQSGSVTIVRSHEMTSAGLRITLPVVYRAKDRFLAILQCHRNERRLAIELYDPSWGLHMRKYNPANVHVFKLCPCKGTTRLKHVVPQTVQLADQREIVIVQARDIEVEDERDDCNNLYLQFRDADELQLQVLWPAPYWDTTAWHSAVYSHERNDLRMVKYCAPFAATGVVSGIGGMSIRDNETGGVVMLCFNSRRGMYRNIIPLEFYQGTEFTLQQRCRAFEIYYMNLFPSYRRDVPLATNPSLLSSMKNDDENNMSRMDPVIATTTLGAKRLVATMYSVDASYSCSYVVLEITTTPVSNGSSAGHWLQWCIPTSNEVDD